MLAKQEQRPWGAGQPGLAAVTKPAWWPCATTPQQHEATASNVPTPGTSWVPPWKAAQERGAGQSLFLPQAGRKGGMEEAAAPPCHSQLLSSPFQGHTGNLGARAQPRGVPALAAPLHLQSTHWCSGTTSLSSWGTTSPSPQQPPLLLLPGADPAAPCNPLILSSPCQGGRLGEPPSQQSNISALPQAPDVPGHPHSPAGQRAKKTPHSLHTGIVWEQTLHAGGLGMRDAAGLSSTAQSCSRGGSDGTAA